MRRVSFKSYSIPNSTPGKVSLPAPKRPMTGELRIQNSNPRCPRRPRWSSKPLPPCGTPGGGIPRPSSRHRTPQICYPQAMTAFTRFPIRPIPATFGHSAVPALSCPQPATVNLACPQLPIWGGGTPPPSVYILYLYCCSKRGQYQGKLRAFEDALRLIKPVRLAHATRGFVILCERDMLVDDSPLTRRAAVVNLQPC